MGVAIRYLLVGVLSVVLYERFLQYNMWLLLVVIGFILLLLLLRSIIKLAIIVAIAIALFYFNVITIDDVNRMLYAMLGTKAAMFGVDNESLHKLTDQVVDNAEHIVERASNLTK